MHNIIYRNSLFYNLSMHVVPVVAQRGEPSVHNSRQLSGMVYQFGR